MPFLTPKLRAAGLAVEHTLKQHRWMWRYGHCKRVLRQWLQQQRDHLHSDASAGRCLLDLRKIANDGEQGRRFHTLVTLLQRGGYQTWMMPHLPFMQTGHRPFKAQALRQVLPFDPFQDRDSREPFDLCLRDARGTSRFAKRTIQVLTSPWHVLDASDLPMPYSFYPSVWDHGEDRRLESYRNTNRIWRLFFGGHCSQESYRRIKKYTRLSLVDRYDVVREVERQFAADTLAICSDPELEAAIRTEHDGFVKIDNAVYRTDADRWLSLLAHADFFLAAPGCDYPLSHNAIEAIAVGTIPVLEYETLFSPPLIDGHNCIAYQGTDGLREALTEIRSMPDHQIRRMRSAVIDYYESHLSAEAFCRDLQNEHTHRLHLFPYLTPASKAA